MVLTPILYNKPDTIWLLADISPTGAGSWRGQGPSIDASIQAASHPWKPTPSQINYPTAIRNTRNSWGYRSVLSAFGTEEFTVVTDPQSCTKLITQNNHN